MAQTVDNNLRFFVWHQGSKLILCQPLSGTVAHALTEGILNTEVTASYPLFPTETPDTETAEYLMFDVFSSRIVPATTTPSDSDLRLMAVAKLRCQYMHRLEMLLQKYIHRFCSPLEVEMHNYLSMLTGNSEFNADHPVVLEYSDILDISHTEGYNDLKMRLDSYGLLKIKAFALFEKFKRSINECYTEQEAKATLEQTKYELYSAAAI